MSRQMRLMMEERIIKSAQPDKADTVDFPTRLRAWMMGLSGHPMDDF
jgi:hypothetical protein